MALGVPLGHAVCKVAQRCRNGGAMGNEAKTPRPGIGIWRRQLNKRYEDKLPPVRPGRLFYLPAPRARFAFLFLFSSFLLFLRI